MEFYSFIGVGLGRELSFLEIFDLARFWAPEWLRPFDKGLRPFHKGVTRKGVINATPG